MFLVRISKTSCRRILVPLSCTHNQYNVTHGPAYLEVGADIPQFPLQEQKNVLVVFPFLVWFRMEASR